MRTFFRYAVSGTLAAAAHFSVLIALVELAGINAAIATTIGFAAAIGVNYSFQYHWTFEATSSHRSTFVRYVVVTIAMMAVNTTMFWVLTEQWQLDYILAQVIATGVVMIANFNINLRYTFSSSN